MSVEKVKSSRGQGLCFIIENNIPVPVFLKSKQAFQFDNEYGSAGRVTSNIVVERELSILKDKLKKL